MDDNWTESEMRVYTRNADAHKTGMGPDQVAQYYSDWSERYEQDLCEGVYNGPTIVASELGTLYPRDRGHVRVLDVAAGTGLLGEKLYQSGFRKLSALDPARGMLEICKRKHIYEELLCEFMCEKELPILKDTYDCIAVSGGMGEGHLPRSALSEMARIVKPGGHVCIVMRREYLDYVTEYKDGQLESAMDDLQGQGHWVKLTQKRVPNYSFNKDGVVFVFQVK